MTLSLEREAVQERREMILGRRAPAWKIAFDMGVSERTVQRHRDHARIGRPIGKQHSPAILARIAEVRALRARNFGYQEISERLGISRRAARRAGQMRL